MMTPAILRGGYGTLRVGVIGYEVDENTEHEDSSWLVVRVEWESARMRLSCEDAMMQAHELQALADALAATESPRYGDFQFLEPTLTLSREPAKGGGPERVTMRLVRETPRGEERLDVSLAVRAADVVAFGEGLRRLADPFPARGAPTSKAPSRRVAA